MARGPPSGPSPDLAVSAHVDAPTPVASAPPRRAQGPMSRLHTQPAAVTAKGTPSHGALRPTDTAPRSTCACTHTRTHTLTRPFCSFPEHFYLVEMRVRMSVCLSVCVQEEEDRQGDRERLRDSETERQGQGQRETGRQRPRHSETQNDKDRDRNRDRYRGTKKQSETKR